MLFNTIQFLIFLPIVIFAYYRLPFKIRWLFLLISNYFFYMCWEPKYAILILFITVVNYSTALIIDKTTDQTKRKVFIVLCLLIDFSMLVFFKYMNFFISAVNNAFRLFNIPISSPAIHILLPIGISFYTFQTLSYMIEVFRGRVKPERHFGYFALYVSFWPLLLAGPIERPQTLLPQFKIYHRFNVEKIETGIYMILRGFFKKVVVADGLAIYVNQVMNDPGSYNGISIIFSIYLFAFQIYCDFSGYSDIAIGSAKLMNIDVMKNFESPYFSCSISEFWKRWHISLTSWFRDYLYIPLGGNKVSQGKWYRNILAVFLVSGLWHGAAWTFVFWGGLHAVYYFIEKISKKYLEVVLEFLNKYFNRIWQLLSILITFNAVCFAWIFFRANSFNDSKIILFKIFHNSTLNLFYPVEGRFQITMAIISTILLLLFEYLEVSYFNRIKNKISIPLKTAFLFLIVIWILNFGVFNSPSLFIYFQF